MPANLILKLQHILAMHLKLLCILFGPNLLFIYFTLDKHIDMVY